MKNQDFLPYYAEKPIRDTALNKKIPLTICISAICEHGLIVGAADRMLTFNQGETEFELKPTSAGDHFTFKVTPLNSAKTIVMMMAGNTSFQSQIALSIFRQVEKMEQNGEPNLTVAQSVGMYVNIYNQIKAKHVEGAVLAPFGLDMPTFLSKQKKFPKGFSETITKQMIDFPYYQGVQTIITGMDDLGSHIYVLDEKDPICYDAVGYAAIGIGASHAKSQFMLNGYSRIVPQEEALWLVYMAKRKAEIASGVGKITDLFSISEQDKKFKSLNQFEPELAQIYDKYEKNLGGAFHAAQRGVKSYLQSLAPAKPKTA